MQRSLTTLSIVLASVLAASGIRAEVFVDLYAGWANTATETSSVDFTPIYLELPPAGALGDSTISHYGVRSTFDDSLDVGVRAGYWFGSWFALAVDAFMFEPDMSGGGGFTQDASLDVLPISVMALFRMPLLRDDSFPLGRTHVYAGGGPSLFITDFDGVINSYVNDDPPVGTIAATPFSATHVDPGGVIVAGMDFQLFPFVGLFAEYRFSFATASYKETVGDIPTEISIPLRTHHIVGGLTFRY